jgi:tRNA pseudouridine synthase 10
MDVNLCRICLLLFYEKIKRQPHIPEEFLRQNYKPTELTCMFCEKLLPRLGEYQDRIMDALKQYQFQSFWISSTGSKTALKDIPELFIRAIKNEIYKKISQTIQLKLKKEPKMKNPDITITINFDNYNISINPSPLFLYGRYLKYVRNIPQTHWPCILCKGKGCQRCGFSGKMYPESVEEIIAQPLLNLTGGSSALMHASGREDIDARMLGNGRPFVMQIIQPKVREFDLSEACKQINRFAKGKVEVSFLTHTDKHKIIQLKQAKYDKTYRVLIETSAISQKIDRLEKICPILLWQQTPSRLLARKSEKVYQKLVKDVKILSVSGNLLELQITAESGTYVKEFITGDKKRTVPCVSDLLGISIKIIEFDVIKIWD